MTDIKCDFCSVVSNSLLLYCSDCTIKMCDICFNGTLGGNCHFLTSKGIHHFPSHNKMTILEGKKEADILLPHLEEKKFYLDCKTYIFLWCSKETNTTVSINIETATLATYAIKITGLGAGIFFSGIDNKILVYKQCEEENRPINRDDIKSLLYDNTYSITYKSSFFSVLIRELLESLDYPENLITHILIDILEQSKHYKTVTFGSIISPYSITSSSNINHLKSILIVWSGNMNGIEVTSSEEERTSKLKTMILPFKENVIRKRSGEDYSLSVTIQHIANSL